MNYLKYIEHAAENLQFYLWYRDYTARFAALPQSEQALSPEWTQQQREAEATAAQQERTKRVNPQVSALLKNTDFANDDSHKAADKVDPFNTPSQTPSLEEKFDGVSEYGSSAGDETLVNSTAARSIAGQAFGDAGMKWQPCTTPILLSYIYIYAPTTCVAY